MSQRRDEQNFIGAQVSPEVSSRLALASEALGVSRSELIRQALIESLDKLAAKKPTLKERMISRLVGQWSTEYAASSGKVTVNSIKQYCAGALQHLLDKGIADNMANSIVAAVEDRLTKAWLHD